MNGDRGTNGDCYVGPAGCSFTHDELRHIRSHLPLTFPETKTIITKINAVLDNDWQQKAEQRAGIVKGLQP